MLKRFSVLVLSLCLVLGICTVGVDAKAKNAQLTSTTTKSRISGRGFSIANESMANDKFVAKISTSTYGVDVGYVNVALEGDGSGKMYAKLWKVGRIKKPNITVKLQKKSTGGYWSTAESGTFTSIGGVVSPSKISCSTSATAIWKVTLSGSLNGGDVSYSTYEFLYNKKAVRYPDYTDPGSNKLMYVPSTNLTKVASSYRVSWTSTDRKNYIKWYDSNYPNKIKDWSKYQIHHIRPREYGGTNDYSNLIPLPTTYHQKTVTPWWSNY